MNDLDDDDELSNLRIVVKDDEKILAPARWLPHVTLRCRDKTCRLLGGHQAATNTIMIWCTCGQRDSAHPDSSRLMALDAWVVEHCRGESLDDYEGQEDEEEDEEGDSKVDALCMQEALVVRAGPNTLPKPVPLRQLLSSALVAQGGNKGLKGASFWVYWYDQPIPIPSAPEHAGLGRTWAPGPLARKDLGVWYKARILKCDTSTGEVKVKYDIDNSEDSMYLLVAFAHFDLEPPARGSRPEVLPDMDLVENLGLPQSAAASGSVSAGAKGKGKKAAAAAAPATKSAAAAAHAKQQAKPQAKSAAHDKPPGPAAKATVQAASLEAPAGGKPPPPALPAAAAGSLQRAPSSTSAVTPPALETGGAGAKSAAAKAPDGGGTAPSKQPPFKIKPPAKRASSPPPAPAQAPLPPKPPSAKQPAAAAAPAPGAGPRPGPAARPAKRQRHEFEVVALASGGPQGSASSAAATGTAATDVVTWPPPRLSVAAWAEREARARSGRRGFLGFLCGRQEQIPVPVFNEVDSAPLPHLEEYVSAEAFENRLATELGDARSRQPQLPAVMDELRTLCDNAQPRWGQPCGLSYHEGVRQKEADDRANGGGGGGGGGGGTAARPQPSSPPPSADSSYGRDGRLLAMRPLGVHECSPACSSPRCRANMTLSRGVLRPLEVFRAHDRVWSLRCSEPLEPGDFVAPLLGRLAPAQQLMEELADAGAGRLPGPPGVVLLNHFFALWEAAYTRGLNWCDRHVRLWQLPPNPLSSVLCRITGGGGAAAAGGADDPARPAARRLSCMLALDTRRVGNVARFVRQWTEQPPATAAAAGAAAPPLSLGPSLVVQPVLAGGCRSPLLYYVGLFAARRVEAGEELTCDLSGMALGGAGPGGATGPAR